MSTTSHISKSYQNAEEFKYVCLCQSDNQIVSQLTCHGQLTNQSDNRPCSRSGRSAVIHLGSLTINPSNTDTWTKTPTKKIRKLISSVFHAKNKGNLWNAVRY
jgi:hypothetical protein